MSRRFEMRLPEELAARVDDARGWESRASFVKRALESALRAYSPSDLVSAPVVGVRPESASARAPVEKEPPGTAESVVMQKSGGPAGKPEHRDDLSLADKAASSRRASANSTPLSEKELQGLRNIAAVVSERPFRCPVRACEFQSSSGRAKCGVHGRTVVPA